MELGKLIKVVLLGILNVVFIWTALFLYGIQAYWILLLLLVGAALINYVFISEKAYPYRYLLPASFFMILLVVYPILYTVYVSLTNYGTGNILSKEQVIAQLQDRRIQDADAGNYSYRVFRDSTGQLWFLFADPQGSLLLGYEGKLEAVTEEEASARLAGFSELARAEVVRATNELSALSFALDEVSYLQMRNIYSFGVYRPQYQYSPERDELTDLESGIVYTPVLGYFQAPDGTRLTPGFREVIGLGNFRKLFANPQVTGPFFRVFLWTVEWALLSVGCTFAVGLFLALLLNDPYLRLRKFYRGILILPYAVPAFISALIWRGLFHTELGVINRILKATIGSGVPWLQDPFWAKVALVILNLWLGFPYMMIVCLGALQSIDNEMYEAAVVDGASPWQQFSHITLPLLMVSVAPLLIASFSFNFNNFSVIYLLTRGRPPIVNAQTPAGHTDILISYTYRLAFESGRGVDYGLASAVTLVIFLITGAITFLNFRFTGELEEVRKNV